MKKGIEFPERERLFVEKMLQTRAANGGAHRILENVTFERRETRLTPPSRRAKSSRHSALLGQDDGCFPHKLPQIIIIMYLHS